MSRDLAAITPEEALAAALPKASMTAWAVAGYPEPGPDPTYWERFAHGVMGALHAQGWDVALLADTADVGPTHVSTPSVEPAGLREAASRIAALTEGDIRDYEQGLCFFCGAGWRRVPGPRGGKGKLVHANLHEPDCTWVGLRAAILPTQASDSPEKT